MTFSESLNLKSYDLKLPKVIIGKNNKNGFIIEEPDDIYKVHLDSIKSVPVMYEKCGKHPSVWGICLVSV